jgi:mitogen-activated protein kinase 1/3
MRPVPGTSDLVFVTDLMETDLACVIRSPQPLSVEHIQFFMYQVVRATLYMHSAGIIHRDLVRGSKWAWPACVRSG